jgi:hypothetical protein
MVATNCALDYVSMHQASKADGNGDGMTYSAKCDLPLFGSLPLEKVEKRAKAAVGVVGRLAVFEAEDFDADFRLAFGAASGAVLLRDVIPDILGESRGCPSRPSTSSASSSSAPGAAAAARGLARRTGWGIAGKDAIHGDIAVAIGSRDAATFSYAAAACGPQAGPVAGASTRTGWRRHWEIVVSLIAIDRLHLPKLNS